MIVVADTSPLNYLILIHETALLPALFKKVLVPQAVSTELLNQRAPQEVRQWINNPPEWIEVRTTTQMTHPQLADLDIGEREAIELALELGIGTILIDETLGRQHAKTLHLQVTGTLGILEQAARLGKVDFASALRKLETTNFRITAALRDAALKRLHP